jgi:hypothetical protein
MKARRTDRHSRYLAIVQWAYARYKKDGVVIVSTGGRLAPYGLIEDLAFDRYVRSPRDVDGCLVFRSN